MNKELREKVARALCTDDGNPCGCVTACKVGLHYADLAIPIIRPAVLAEAAEVCEAKGEEWRKHGNRGAGVGCNTCTDAIRSLMSKP